MTRVTVARARSIVLALLTVEVAVLVTTGAVLYFAYRPDAADAWTDVSASLSRDITLGSVMREVHRWAAWLAVATTMAAAVLLAVRTGPTEQVGRGLAVGVGLVIAVPAASFTGYLLPWDQLALFAVTVGTNISGYTWLRSGDVRFVLMGGTEIAPATLLKWLVLHVVVLGGAVVGLVVLAWRRPRPRATPPQTAETTRPAGVAVGV